MNDASTRNVIGNIALVAGLTIFMAVALLLSASLKPKSVGIPPTTTTYVPSGDHVIITP